jgi:hypothetical protein
MRTKARQVAKQLKEASRDAIWMESPPQWIIQVVSQITYFTAGDVPAYITHNLTQVNGTSETVYSFTTQHILVTTVKKETDGSAKINTISLPLKDLTSVKLLGVSSIFSDAYDEWPHAVNVEVAFQGTTFRVPQAAEPTNENLKELERLVRSLINKV